MRDSKQAKVNESRTAEARDWAEAGHTRYVWMARFGLSSAGSMEDISLEIEAVEAGGWKLDQMASAGNGLIVLLVFARA